MNRAEIHKQETDQMNRSSDWFRKNYGEVNEDAHHDHSDEDSRWRAALR